jgi:hypothetical protein
VRLEHGDAEELYRDPLQAATLQVLLFGFRKMGKSSEEAPDSYVKLNHARVLGLANRVATAISTGSSSAIGSDRGWNDQAVEEQNGDSQDEQHTFH